MTTDREDAEREHKSTLIRDHLIEEFPDYRLAPDWWDTTHSDGEQCFRLDGDVESLQVRVERPLMMNAETTMADIKKLLASWNPRTQKRIRLTTEGLRSF